ncbi:hypothetical protein R3W88_011618 [Solanum pinnatisectum]|uniref:alcohol dehydrogenase n=1 Tax=Solanum pinnatisectum TaxID=50273 RepID=A0AAV9LAA1_9SOLN|nr:hypothetical protein R3W88_011618 [Solanum pinnatisectum]
MFIPLFADVFESLGATLNVAKPTKDSSVAIFGLGAVGLAAAEGARILAKKFGVTQFVNPKDYSKPVQEVIAEMTDGGVDRSVECTGHIDTMIPAFECGWGVAVLVGVPHKEVLFKTYPMNFLNERTLKETFFGNYKPSSDIPSNFRTAFLLMKKAFLSMKGIEDELIIKLKSAIKEVADGDAEYSLLVNLKRLDDLQLSRQISIESLHNDLAETDVFEISKRDITISMMRNYPQLPHKFMSDKAKIHYLLEVIVHMNLERDSLKRQHQNFTSAVLLKKKAFLKHGVKEALRSCVKALNFCATVSCGELQDFALNKFKGIEDELVIKIKSALKEVADGDDEYSLLF